MPSAHKKSHPPRASRSGRMACGWGKAQPRAGGKPPIRKPGSKRSLKYVWPSRTGVGFEGPRLPPERSAQEQTEIDSYEQELGSKSTGPDQIQTGCAAPIQSRQARPLGREVLRAGVTRTPQTPGFCSRPPVRVPTTRLTISSDPGAVKAFRACRSLVPKGPFDAGCSATSGLRIWQKNPSLDPARFRQAGDADFSGRRGR